MKFQNYDGLRFFESVARCGSFALASKELNLTKGAISYQIKNLEADLGFILFDRGPRGVNITPKGSEFLVTVQFLIGTLEKKISEVRQSESKTVTLGVPTYFALRWLSPRLMGFMHKFPQIALRIEPLVNDADLLSRNIDIAILWGDGNWQHKNLDPFLISPAWPVGCPEIAKHVDEVGLEEAFTGLTLLHDSESSAAWSHWFKVAGLKYENRANTLIIQDPNVRAQAVIDGQGVALYDSLISKEIEQGKLVRLSDFALNNYGFFLHYLTASSNRREVESLATWLKEQT